MKLARNLSLRAVQRLGELMESEDDRVVAVACNSILDRAFGKPKAAGEEKDDLLARLEAMAPEQRVEEARKLLEEGKKYLPAYREWERRRRREG
jgi:hypothetical protein